MSLIGLYCGTEPRRRARDGVGILSTVKVNESQGASAGGLRNEAMNMSAVDSLHCEGKRAML